MRCVAIRPSVTAASPIDPRALSVLAFWFGDPAPHDAAGIAARNRVWFGRDAGFDAQIRRRFADPAGNDPTRTDLLSAAARGDLDGWLRSAPEALALLIVLDQFPRNLYRADARAFALDHKARALALAALAHGLDAALAPIERMFMYLPLEHAEDLAMQDRCVALFTALRDQAPPALRSEFESFLDYAQRHRAVIARYGRFPHRNAALGRVNHAAEIAYLATPGAGF